MSNLLVRATLEKEKFLKLAKGFIMFLCGEEDIEDVKDYGLVLRNIDISIDRENKEFIVEGKKNESI